MIAAASFCVCAEYASTHAVCRLASSSTAPVRSRKVWAASFVRSMADWCKPRNSSEAHASISFCSRLRRSSKLLPAVTSPPGLALEDQFEAVRLTCGLSRAPQRHDRQDRRARRLQAELDGPS